VFKIQEPNTTKLWEVSTGGTVGYEDSEGTTPQVYDAKKSYMRVAVVGTGDSSV